MNIKTYFTEGERFFCKCGDPNIITRAEDTRTLIQCMNCNDWMCQMTRMPFSDIVKQWNKRAMTVEEPIENLPPSEKILPSLQINIYNGHCSVTGCKDLMDVVGQFNHKHPWFKTYNDEFQRLCYDHASQAEGLREIRTFKEESK